MRKTINNSVGTGSSYPFKMPVHLGLPTLFLAEQEDQMNRNKLKEFIEKKLDTINPKILTSHIKDKHPSIYNEIIKKTSYLDSGVIYTERIYHILENLYCAPKCNCGNNLHFLGIRKGYTKHCCCKCVPHSEISKNWFATIDKNYFSKRISESLQKISKKEWERAAKKRKKTKIEKYGNKLVRTYENIFSFFRDRGCELLESESTYKNTHRKVKYRCSCGNITYITPKDFIQGHRCMICAAEKRSGAGNGRWNPEMSDQERRLRKTWMRSHEHKIWVKSVFSRDGYKCRICGGKKWINAHHIYNWSQYKDLRTVVSNGITMCRECHMKFHNEYGKKNNNFEQIKEFKLGVENGCR